MQSVAPPLDELRAEIDRIDRAILELLVERTDVVRRIGEVKNDRHTGRLAMRPAREACILRRLAASAGDRFPTAVLVRMWRELLAAQTRLQAPLSVAVCAPRGFATWDLARDHFGSLTPMKRVESAGQAVRAVANGSATVAVLPLPCDDDPSWLALLSDQQDRLRAFARLPFVAEAEGERGGAHALAIARIEIEPSGDDLGLLAIEARPDVSRARIGDLLAAGDLEPVWRGGYRGRGEPQVLHVVETSSLVQDGDERLARLLGAGRGELSRIVPVGGYPRPLRPAGPALTPAPESP